MSTHTRAHYDNMHPCSNSHAILERVLDIVTGGIGTNEVDVAGAGQGRERMELD